MNTDELDCLLLEYASRGERAIPPGFDRETVMQRRAELLRLGYGIGGVQRGGDKSVASAVIDELTEAGKQYYEQNCRRRSRS